MQSDVVADNCSMLVAPAARAKRLIGSGKRAKTAATTWLLEHPILFVFLLSLLIRVTCVLTIHYVIGENAFGVGDDDTYAILAEGMAEGHSAGWDAYSRELYNSTAAFTVPLTVIYLVFGSVDVGGPLLAAIFGSLAAALVARLVLEVLPRSYAIAAGIAAAVFPSQVLWSSLTLKDSAVWATLAGLAVVAAAANRRTGAHLALSGLVVVVLLLILAHLRAHSFIVATWAVMIAALFSSRASALGRITGAALVALTLPWLLGFGPAGIPFALNQDLESRRTANAFGAATAFVAPPPQQAQARLRHEVEEEIRALGARLRTANSPEEQEAVKRRLQRARQQIRAIQPPPTPQDEVLSPNLQHLPKGLSVMLFEPYPWQNVSNSRVRLAQLENILWYPVLALALVGLVQVVRKKHLRNALMFTILVGGGTLLVYALAEGNFGTAYRHRGEFVWAAIALAAVGAYELNATRRGDAAAAVADNGRRDGVPAAQDSITEANSLSHLASTESLLCTSFAKLLPVTPAFSRPRSSSR